jgi:hypothetical protein
MQEITDMLLARIAPQLPVSITDAILRAFNDRVPDTQVIVPPRMCAVQMPPCNSLAYEGVLCTFHLYCIGLSIRMSLLVNAGRGLFATKVFEAGRHITYYSGEIHAKNTKAQGRYVMQVAPNHIVDAARSDSGPARFINDPGVDNVNDPRINCRIMMKTGTECQKVSAYRRYVAHENRLKHAAVIAMRRIEIDEELYASYGWEYWASPEERQAARLSRRQPSVAVDDDLDYESGLEI